VVPVRRQNCRNASVKPFPAVGRRLWNTVGTLSRAG
jgi:hypothetical protein